MKRPPFPWSCGAARRLPGGNAEDTFRGALTRGYAIALCLALAAGAASEAEGKPPGPPAAKVLAGHGAVTVQLESGSAVSAKHGLQLAAGDLLRVPVGGAVVIELLGNQHVVRIDEELELRVNELALFGAPRTTASVADQLAQALTAEEKKNLPARMTGWYANASAADVPAPTDEGDGSARPVQPPAPASKPASPPTAPRDEAFGDKEAYGGRPAAQPPPKEQLSAERTHQAPPEKKAGAAAPVPAWATHADAKTLRTCLTGTLSKLLPNLQDRLGPTLELKYRPDGPGWRLALEGALPVPGCAVSWFRQHPPPRPAPGWTKLELPL